VYLALITHGVIKAKYSLIVQIATILTLCSLNVTLRIRRSWAIQLFVSSFCIPSKVAGNLAEPKLQKLAGQLLVQGCRLGDNLAFT
jgi:hypothetical protein